MAQFYSAKRRTTTRQIITVSVNDLDSFGQGVARHNGKTLFIPGLLPQENAEVTVTEDKKQYARAKVVRRLSDSPERETPRCPHFGVCGGCPHFGVCGGAAVSNNTPVWIYSSEAKVRHSPD